jgi:hypothetical protein
MNTIAVVLTPNGLGSQVLINGVEVTDACRAIEISAEVGHPTTVILTLIGSVELMADVGRIVIEHEPRHGD